MGLSSILCFLAYIQVFDYKLRGNIYLKTPTPSFIVCCNAWHFQDKKFHINLNFLARFLAVLWVNILCSPYFLSAG